jgi:hypothetical protein
MADWKPACLFQIPVKLFRRLAGKGVDQIQPDIFHSRFRSQFYRRYRFPAGMPPADGFKKGIVESLDSDRHPVCPRGPKGRDFFPSYRFRISLTGKFTIARSLKIFLDNPAKFGNMLWFK